MGAVAWGKRQTMIEGWLDGHDGRFDLVIFLMRMRLFIGLNRVWVLP
jgi:hypothetical protein